MLLSDFLRISHFSINADESISEIDFELAVEKDTMSTRTVMPVSKIEIDKDNKRILFKFKSPENDF